MIAAHFWLGYFVYKRISPPRYEDSGRSVLRHVWALFCLSLPVKGLFFKGSNATFISLHIETISAECYQSENKRTQLTKAYGTIRAIFWLLSVPSSLLYLWSWLLHDGSQGRQSTNSWVPMIGYYWWLW